MREHTIRRLDERFIKARNAVDVDSDASVSGVPPNTGCILRPNSGVVSQHEDKRSEVATGTGKLHPSRCSGTYRLVSLNYCRLERRTVTGRLYRVRWVHIVVELIYHE